MFNKKEALSPTQFDVIIGKNTTIEGKITSEGSVRIDGILNGDIVSRGHVLIGTEAKTTGDIEAVNVEISGEVEGNVNATGAFRIYETGMLFGDIKVSSFAIDEGGVFEGMCHINTQGVKSPSKRRTVESHLENIHENKKKDHNKDNKDQPKDNQEKLKSVK